MATWNGKPIKYDSDDGYFNIKCEQHWEYQTTSDHLSIHIKTGAYSGYDVTPEHTRVDHYNYDDSRVLLKTMIDWAETYLGEGTVEKLLLERKNNVRE